MPNPFGNSFDDFSDDTFLNADEIRQDLFDESVTPNKSEPKEVSRPKKSLAEDLGLDVDETLIEEKPSTQSTSKEINVTEEEGNIVIYTEPTDLHKGIAALKAAGITEFSTTELEMIAQSEVELSPEDLEIFEGLVDALEDDDDVQKVYHNVANL